ncbi:MAG TPA: hypothetical protein PKD55_07140 [Bellilinea sp.]|nr:hypothetical protein [Bellilinea sp.]
MNDHDDKFWEALDELTSSCELIIDRPKGSAHPRYPELIFPLDYGYLRDTASMDGSGIDIWRGTSVKQSVCGIVVIVDMNKRDSEIKILYACTPTEIETVHQFHNTWLSHGYLIRR